MADAADDNDADTGLGARVKALIAWAMRQKPVRVAQQFTQQRAPILGSGLAYQALFAGFAALWATFSIAGAVVSRDLGLRRSVIDVMREYVPGLIQGEDGEGAIDPDVLLNAGVYGWSGAISIVVLTVLALGWLASARAAIREVFDLPPMRVNFVLLKLRDLAFGVGFGVVILVTAALSVASTGATGFLLDLIGIDPGSTPGAIVSRIVTLAVMFVLDAVVIGALYRVLANIRIPWRHLRQGALLGAIGLGALKVGGSLLLGGASNNPLIASFAVIAGLLIFFNLICQVVLFSATWIAVGVKDDDVVLDEAVAAERLEAARRLVAAHEPPERERRGFFARLFRRRSRASRVE